jgi:hypothetical protein
MDQVVSRRPLTAEARVHARVNPCGICGGQRGTGTGFFSPGYSVFPCQYHSTVALQTHITWGMRNMLTYVVTHILVLDPPHLQEKKMEVYGWLTQFRRTNQSSVTNKIKEQLDTINTALRHKCGCPIILKTIAVQKWFQDEHEFIIKLSLLYTLHPE